MACAARGCTRGSDLHAGGRAEHLPAGRAAYIADGQIRRSGAFEHQALEIGAAHESDVVVEGILRCTADTHTKSTAPGPKLAAPLNCATDAAARVCSVRRDFTWCADRRATRSRRGHCLVRRLVHARPCVHSRVEHVLCAHAHTCTAELDELKCTKPRRARLIALSDAPLSTREYKNFEGEGEAGRSAQADRDARRSRSGAVEGRARSLTFLMLVTVAGMVSTPSESLRSAPEQHDIK